MLANTVVDNYYAAQAISLHESGRLAMIRPSQSPRIPEGQVEELSFRPELFEWWRWLSHWADTLHVCHRWLAGDHPLEGSGADALEQRSIPTLALCLAGVARIESGNGHLDLAAGEAVVIAPGAWHRHMPLRPGSVIYRQGFILGRSDFFIMNNLLHLVATVPEQPSRRLMEEVLLCDDNRRRTAVASALLSAVIVEEARPRMIDPAVLAMIYALQNTLHLPNGVDAAVRASGLSRAQAYRWFKKYLSVGLATVRRQQLKELANWLRKERHAASS